MLQRRTAQSRHDTHANGAWVWLSSVKVFVAPNGRSRGFSGRKHVFLTGEPENRVEGAHFLAAACRMPTLAILGILPFSTAKALRTFPGLALRRRPAAAPPFR
jgi:hypothetical protein